MTDSMTANASPSWPRCGRHGIANAQREIDRMTGRPLPMDLEDAGGDALLAAARAVIESADAHEVGLPSDESLDALRAALAAAKPAPAIDVERLARAIHLNVHVDEEHGFPPHFTAGDLAEQIIAEYAKLGEEG